MIATALIKFTGEGIMPSLFMVLMAMTGLIGMFLIQDRSREPLQS